MPDITLYDYQDSGVNEVGTHIQQGNKHILFQLPTGGGKTIIFSSIAKRAEAKGKKVLIFTDREELLNQADKTLTSFDLNCSLIQAGSKFIDHRKSIFIAMSQTFRRRINQKEWIDFICNDIDLIIIDEAHIQEFNYIFESGLLDEKIVIGFTATPIRGGNMRQLGLDYHVMIRGAEVKDLIGRGYLLNCDLMDLGKIDLTNVKTNSLDGDYNADEVFKKFNTNKVYSGLIKTYKTHTPNEKMLVFCCNVEHAIKTTIALNENGINSKFVVSGKNPPKKPKEDAKAGTIKKYEEDLRKYEYYKYWVEKYGGERTEIIQQFKDNEFPVLVNVDIATKGFDCPDIKVVAIYRATNSLALWLQMLGRGARLCTKIGKTHFTVFDFGGNKERLGHYDSNRTWSLWHDTKKVDGIPPLKECGIDSNNKPIKSANNIEKGCKRLILVPYRLCPFCGFKYPEKNEAAEVELVLASIVDENGVSLKAKKFKDMDWVELTKYRDLKKQEQKMSTRNGIVYSTVGFDFSGTEGRNGNTMTTNGQLLIGKTGDLPQIGYLTSTDGTVTIANGGGAIDVSTTSIPGLSGTTNIGFSYTGGTGVFKITGANGSALSSTNKGYVNIQSKTNPGQVRRVAITEDQQFIDDAGASTIIGNLFGMTTAVAVTVDVPFFIYAVLSTDETSASFMISRVPANKYLYGAGNIGKSGSAIADSYYDFFALGDPTVVNYAAQPCIRIGCFRMRMSAADDWTVQALDHRYDGIGEYPFPLNVYTMPRGQFGAAAGKYFFDNGGTAPDFAAGSYVYSISPNGLIILSGVFTFNTAGVGAVVAKLALPFPTSNAINYNPGFGYQVITAVYALAQMNCSDSTYATIITAVGGTTNQTFQIGDSLVFQIQYYA